jgi:hypothetical protein
MCCLVDEDLAWCLLQSVHRKSSHSGHQVAANLDSLSAIFQDGCSYTFTLLLAIVYLRCFLFRNVDMAPATTQCCNICDHDNESKLAATWCPECEDFLCTDCNRHHARSSSTKQHWHDHRCCNIVLLLVPCQRF